MRFIVAFFVLLKTSIVDWYNLINLPNFIRFKCLSTKFSEFKIISKTFTSGIVETVCLQLPSTITIIMVFVGQYLGSHQRKLSDLHNSFLQQFGSSEHINIYAYHKIQSNPY